MKLPPDLSIRDATGADLPDIAAMRESVGWGVQEWALRAVIEQPDARCVVVVSDDGPIVGVGSGIVYGPMGFVGNMIVAGEHRRRGIGSAILEAVTDYLEAAGCSRLELNATTEGRPLYERHGFRSIGTSRFTSIPRSAPVEPHPEVRVRDASPDDVDAIAAYDRPRFGGDRRRLLGQFVAEAPTLIAKRDGELAGYGVLRVDGGRIGPFLADEPAVAAALLAEAFSRAPEVPELRINLPPNNRRGAEWLRSLGLMLETWDGRMARGAELPKREETLYGMAVGALG